MQNVEEDGRTGYDDGRYHRPKEPRGPINEDLRSEMAEREKVREQRQIVHPTAQIPSTESSQYLDALHGGKRSTHCLFPI